MSLSDATLKYHLSLFPPLLDFLRPISWFLSNLGTLMKINNRKVSATLLEQEELLKRNCILGIYTNSFSFFLNRNTMGWIWLLEKRVNRWKKKVILELKFLIKGHWHRCSYWKKAECPYTTYAAAFTFNKGSLFFFFLTQKQRLLQTFAKDNKHIIFSFIVRNSIITHHCRSTSQSHYKTSPQGTHTHVLVKVWRNRHT